MKYLPVENGNQWSCPRSSCNFKSKQYGLTTRHIKTTCQFAKKKKAVKSKAKSAEVVLKNATIVSRIASGGYGDVYNARIKDLFLCIKYTLDLNSFNKQVAVYEKAKTLKGKKFPTYYGSTKISPFYVIGIEKMDGTLDDILKKNFELSSIMNFFLQTIDRLKDLHNMGFVHRDLKFNNIAFSNSKVYLIDFGNSLEISEKHGNAVFGCLRYMSRRSHLFIQQTPCDDLQNVCFMLVEVLLRNLPWNQLCKDYSQGKLTLEESMKAIRSQKLNFCQQKGPQIHPNVFKLFSYLEEEMQVIDYDEIKNLMRGICPVKKGKINFQQKKEGQYIGIPFPYFEPKFNKRQNHSPDFQPILDFNIVIPSKKNIFSLYKLEKILEKSLIQHQLANDGFYEGNHYHFKSIKSLGEIKEQPLLPGLYLFQLTHLFEKSYFIVIEGVDKIVYGRDLSGYRRSKIQTCKRQFQSGYYCLAACLKILGIGIEKWIQFEIDQGDMINPHNRKESDQPV